MRIMILIFCFIIINNSYSQDTLDCEGLLEVIKENKGIPQDYFFETISNLPPCAPTTPYFELGIPFYSSSKIYLCDVYLDTIDNVFDEELSAGLYRINLNFQNYTFHHSGIYLLVVNVEQSGDFDISASKLRKKFNGYGKFIVIK